MDFLTVKVESGKIRSHAAKLHEEAIGDNANRRMSVAWASLSSLSIHNVSTLASILGTMNMDKSKFPLQSADMSAVCTGSLSY